MFSPKILSKNFILRPEQLNLSLPSQLLLSQLLLRSQVFLLLTGRLLSWEYFLISSPKCMCLFSVTKDSKFLGSPPKTFANALILLVVRSASLIFLQGDHFPLPCLEWLDLSPSMKISTNFWPWFILLTSSISSLEEIGIFLLF